MKLVNRWGEGRDQRANKMLTDQKHILLFCWLSLLLEYKESDTKKKMENMLYGKSNQLVLARLLASIDCYDQGYWEVP